MAMKEASRLGAKVLVVSNVVDSSMARAADVRAVRPMAWRKALATVGTSGWTAKPRNGAPS